MNSPIELKVVVSESYADKLRDAIELSADACCGDSESLAAYPAEVLEKLPGSVVTFGCGNPVALASMQPGETVLDLGSGAGLDCFLAAEQVGEQGAVIGVDFTQDMIDKANENATKLGLNNVSFKHGDIEALPLEDSTVDVVISNCVINLAPDKDAVFREAFRVLAPGGRLHVSDMLALTADGPRLTDSEAWASCIGGAEYQATYLGRMESAGFVEIATTDEALRFDENEAPLNVASVKVSARKPA